MTADSTTLLPWREEDFSLRALPSEICRSPLHPTAEDFFARAIGALCRSAVPFLLGGGYAMREYTGICRRTKDLDVFVHPVHRASILECLAREGYRAELTDGVWLAKVFCNEHFIDIIWSSGNGIATVDDAWFEHAVPTHLFGHDVMLVPPEEMIWSKAYVMERERFDGADIAHLILKCGQALDYGRLLSRMSDHWEIFLVHLMLFRFIYPTERQTIPDWVFMDLEDRMQHSRGPSDPSEERISRGPLVSKKEYVVDLETFGYSGPPPAAVHITPAPPKGT